MKKKNWNKDLTNTDIGKALKKHIDEKLIFISKKNKQNTK